jgi:hypothetical protein
MKTPENKEEDPDNTEPADVGDIQIEHSSDYHKITCENCGTV